MSQYAHGCSFTVNTYFIIQNYMPFEFVRVFYVVISWLVKYGCDSKVWKYLSIEQISANGLAAGALAFKI